MKIRDKIESEISTSPLLSSARIKVLLSKLKKDRDYTLNLQFTGNYTDVEAFYEKHKVGRLS